MTATALDADGVAAELKRTFEDILEVQDPPLDADIVELGGDSLMAVEIAMLIEERLDVEVPLTVLEAGSSIRALTDYVLKVRADR